jgi:hypothetical protein
LAPLLTIAALLGLVGFVVMSFSQESKTAFPGFLTVVAGAVLAMVGGAGRWIGLL